MLTEDQLADQLGAQLRREVAAIAPGPGLLASLRRPRTRRSLAWPAGAVAAAAAAAAVVMIVSAGGGGVVPSAAPAKAKPAVLTATGPSSAC